VKADSHDPSRCKIGLKMEAARSAKWCSLSIGEKSLGQDCLPYAESFSLCFINVGETTATTCKVCLRASIATRGRPKTSHICRPKHSSQIGQVVTKKMVNAFVRSYDFQVRSAKIGSSRVEDRVEMKSASSAKLSMMALI
jgi:hypothetical protein